MTLLGKVHEIIIKMITSIEIYENHLWLEEQERERERELNEEGSKLPSF